MKEWISARELAGLPGLPGSERGVLLRARRTGWISRSAQRRGGGREYALSALPEETRAHLEAEAMEQTAMPFASAPVLPPALLAAEQGTAHLRDWQRERLAARLVVLDYIEQIARDLGLSREKALALVIERARKRELPPHIQAQAEAANAHAANSAARLLSRRTVLRWRAERERGLTHLAPKAQKEQVPIWARPLLQFWQQPQKPSLAEALRLLTAAGVLPAASVPSYDAARRFLGRMGELERAKGRMLPHALRALRPFVRRDTSELRPGDVYTADGHTFDAEVAHPIHGRPFRPEITLILDAATRRPVGWACTLAETALAVVDALRHACLRCGIPAIFYADRGPGYRNEMLEGPAIGFAVRLGITVEHSRPQNPQAHGLVERAHKTLWVNAARALPTYMGAGMDRQARQRAHKASRAGVPGAMPSWQEFCAGIEAAVAAYEHRPHRGLPKIDDPITGKRRHWTPLEAWSACAHGGAPEVPAPEVADDLFRPQLMRTAQRCEVSLFGNTYFSHDLAEHHGRQVAVGYDVWDATQVWVRDPEGALLAVAHVDGNKRHYFPRTVVDVARERRETGRLKRLQRHRDEILAEAQGALLTPDSEPLTPEEQAAAQAMRARLLEAPAEPAPTADGRPVFQGEFAERDWGRFCQAHFAELDAAERGMFLRRLESGLFRALVGIDEQAAEQLSRAVG